MDLPNEIYKAFLNPPDQPPQTPFLEFILGELRNYHHSAVVPYVGFLGLFMSLIENKREKGKNPRSSRPAHNDSGSMTYHQERSATSSERQRDREIEIVCARYAL